MTEVVGKIKGLIARLLALVIGLVAFAAAVFFSAIVIAVLIAMATAALAYLWWRTRSGREHTTVIDVESREIERRDLE